MGKTDGYKHLIKNKMKKIKFYTALIILLTVAKTFAGGIYVEKYKSNAQIKVYIVDYKSDADLLVYVAAYRSEADGKDEIWHFEDYRSSADASIYYVDYRSDADLKIYFVKYKSEAGWKTSNKFRGRLK